MGSESGGVDRAHAVGRGAPVVVVCRRLPLPISSGLDLRLRALVRVLAAVRPVVVVALHGSSDLQDPGATHLVMPPAQSASSPADVMRRALDGNLASTFPSADPVFASRVSELVRTVGADTVILSRLEMARLVDVLPVHSGVRAILDLDEAEGPLTRTMINIVHTRGHRLLFDRYSLELARIEASSVRDFPGPIWVSTALEAENVQGIHPEAHVVVVPNCIDVEPYQPAVRPDPGEPSWLFPARFDYLPNQDAAHRLLEVLPRKSRRESLVLAGSRMPSWLSEAERWGVAICQDPADMRPLLWATTGLIAPLRSGGGSRMKVLEAMAAGTPVVASDVAVQGLDVETGVHFLPIDERPDWVDVLDDVVHDASRTKEMTESALHWVRAHHSTTVLTHVVGQSLDE